MQPNDSYPSCVTLTAVKSQNSRRFFSKAFSLEKARPT